MSFTIEHRLWEDVFDEVVKNSTWGSSKAGGPVWVMDFRFQSLKALCPDFEFIKVAEKGFAESDRMCFGSVWLEFAEYYIRYWEICNVMVITDALDGTKVRFYSLLSFVNLLNRVLAREVEKGAPLSEISFILDRQSKFIENEDYIWRTEWYLRRNEMQGFVFPSSHDFARKGNSMFYEPDEYRYLPYIMPRLVEFRNVEVGARYTASGKELVYRETACCTDPYLLVKKVDDWEVYVPNIIYDLMEFLSMGFFDDKYWRSKPGKFQYPWIQYWTGRQISFSRYWGSSMCLRPEPQTAYRHGPYWHRADCFKPKCYWETKRSEDVAKYRLSKTFLDSN
ncbi:MAG: hypothetical protein J6J35_02465 [Alphaproteobacteria bacterium]|nr:hypothetical protein [Alphaproteobacteria bacterium]